VAQPGHEHQVHRLRGHQHADGDLHRRADVLARVEGRRQHLDGHQAEQAHPIAAQRHHGVGDVPGVEGPVVVEHRHQGLRDDEQASAQGKASSSTRRSPQSSMPE
jgi:hypothetical protein